MEKELRISYEQPSAEVLPIRTKGLVCASFEGERQSYGDAKEDVWE